MLPPMDGLFVEEHQMNHATQQTAQVAVLRDMAYCLFGKPQSQPSDVARPQPGDVARPQPGDVARPQPSDVARSQPM